MIMTKKGLAEMKFIIVIIIIKFIIIVIIINLSDNGPLSSPLDIDKQKVLYISPRSSTPGGKMLMIINMVMMINDDHHQ